MFFTRSWFHLSRLPRFLLFRDFAIQFVFGIEALLDQPAVAPWRIARVFGKVTQYRHWQGRDINRENAKSRKGSKMDKCQARIACNSANKCETLIAKRRANYSPCFSRVRGSIFPVFRDFCFFAISRFNSSPALKHCWTSQQWHPAGSDLHVYGKSFSS